MKKYVIFLAIAGFSALAHAQTADIKTPKDSPIVFDNTGKWTEQDVSKYCYHKNNDANKYDNCLKRNKVKIGRDKYPGEAGKLNEADRALSKRAAEGAAKNIPQSVKP